MKQEYSTFDIDKRLGVKRNCIQPWLDAGFIKPSIQRATRRGQRNLFSVSDLYRIKLFQELLETGISRREASFYTNVNFENVGAGKGKYQYAVIKRRKLRELQDSGVFTDLELSKEAPTIVLGKEYSFCVVVNLLNVKEQVDELIHS